MRKQFKDTIIEIGTHNDKIVMILGDVSVYLFREFQEKYPERFFNMGICENTLISVSAGLSSQGFIPFVHSIAPFVTERSYEQIKMDMCYNAFGGNIVSCGASFDYAWDGPSHHSYSDLAIMRLLPGTEVLQPGANREVDFLIRSQFNNGKTTYFRLSDNPHSIDVGDIEFGKGVILKDSGSKLTVMTSGPILGNVMEACRDLDVNLVYFHTIKPIDKELIVKYKTTDIMVINDAYGLYEAICEVPNISVSCHGVPTEFCDCYGTVPDIRKMLGLDINTIKEVVSHKLLNRSEQ